VANPQRGLLQAMRPVAPSSLPAISPISTVGEKQKPRCGSEKPWIEAEAGEVPSEARRRGLPGLPATEIEAPLPACARTPPNGCPVALGCDLPERVGFLASPSGGRGVRDHFLERSYPRLVSNPLAGGCRPEGGRRRGSKRCRDHGLTPLPALRAGLPPEGGAKTRLQRRKPQPSHHREMRHQGGRKPTLVTGHW
jgi:hypothetical protein